MMKEDHPRKVEKAQLDARKSCLDTLKWLAQTFPHAFNTEENVKPLKIGIINDIFAYLEANQITHLSKSKIRQAMVMFTRRMEYLVCLKCREPRVDLDGKTTTDVTEDEALQAKEKIKRHVDKSIRIKHQVKRQCVISSHDSLPVIRELKPVTTEITVKKKVQRRYDPKAVERLKEKLRLAKSAG